LKLRILRSRSSKTEGLFFMATIVAPGVWPFMTVL
jgi:hypothetical protein